MEIKKVKVTPELAKSLLAINQGNRAISNRIVSQLAGAIARGEWIENSGETIKFAGNYERLIDGQHRLSAIVLADTALNLHLAINCNEESFKVLDTGKKRTAQDVFSINGIKNTARTSSGIKTFILRSRGHNGKASYLRTDGSSLTVSTEGITNSLLLEYHNYLKIKYDVESLVGMLDQLYQRSLNVIPPAEFVGQTFLALEKGIVSEMYLFNEIPKIDRTNSIIDFFQIAKLKNVKYPQNIVTDVVAHFFYCFQKGSYPQKIHTNSYNGRFKKLYGFEK